MSIINDTGNIYFEIYLLHSNIGHIECIHGFNNAKTDNIDTRIFPFFFWFLLSDEIQIYTRIDLMASLFQTLLNIS